MADKILQGQKRWLFEYLEDPEFVEGSNVVAGDPFKEMQIKRIAKILQDNYK